MSMMERNIYKNNQFVNMVKKQKDFEKGILSQISKLTIQEDKMEFDILRMIIDIEKEIESRGFKGSKEELFNKAIEEIGEDKLIKKFEKYSAFRKEIEPKLKKLETIFDNITQPTIKAIDRFDDVSTYSYYRHISYLRDRLYTQPSELHKEKSPESSPNVNFYALYNKYLNLYSTRSHSVGKTYEPDHSDIWELTHVHLRPKHTEKLEQEF